MKSLVVKIFVTFLITNYQKPLNINQLKNLDHIFHDCLCYDFFYSCLCYELFSYVKYFSLFNTLFINLLKLIFSINNSR